MIGFCTGVRNSLNSDTLALDLLSFVMFNACSKTETLSSSKSPANLLGVSDVIVKHDADDWSSNKTEYHRSLATVLCCAIRFTIRPARKIYRKLILQRCLY